MADIDFTITQDNVKTEMTKVWEMANKGLKGGPVLVTLGREKKSRAQEKCYHAQINDFAKIEVNGSIHKPKIWKAMLVTEFAKERMEMGKPLAKGVQHVLSLCGQFMITVRPETKEFTIPDANEFIEFLNAKAVEYEVVFSNTALTAYQTYREANG